MKTESLKPLPPDREILHVDMDAFFVSVEETLDPSLKGKPVVVGGDPDGRGVVAAASYVARRFGIHSAMPLSRARRLCPSAIFLRGSHAVYSECSRRIFTLFDKYSPAVEPMSLDEAYLDLTGCGKLHGPILNTAERLRNEIKVHAGINASIGIASNKLMAKVGSTLAKPNGMLWIAPGMEGRFLSPLPVGRIPGIGPKSAEQFRRMGIHSVGDLAALPLELLEEVYGKWGAQLFLKARGICQSPVVGGQGDNRSISRETTLQTDSLDAAFLESKLSYLVEKATAQLRESGLYTRSIVLKLRYSDFKTVTRSHTLSQATSEDHVVFKTVRGLFRKLIARRTRVRLIGVGLTSLTAAPHFQNDLFEGVSREKCDRLYRGIDRIRNKYGFGSILRAASVRQEETE
jgi:DNA polymerase-4